MRTTRKADWVTVDDAREVILRSVPRMATELLTLREAEGRVLAESLTSPLDLPPWNNSAMDGFAVRSDDVLGATSVEPRVLSVIEDIPAGARPIRSITSGEAARIMTGAPVPDGADCVVRVEHTDGGRDIGEVGASVRVLSDADAGGRNVRRRGEDLLQGAVALREGTMLRPGEIGVAAALGHARLRVTRRPRVALLASGDELVDVHGFADVLAGRRIVSSNSYSVAAQLREAGAEVIDLGIATDSPEHLRSLLSSARGCDALVTVAGMSVGEHDHMITLLAELDTAVEFWRVKMRPGSPCAFGRVGAMEGMPWFGLPGNPVSAIVTCEIFVRPALFRMAGARHVHSPVVRCSVAAPIEGSPGLTRFLRVRLQSAADGPSVAILTGSQGSGILTSTVEADALLVVNAARAAVSSGDVLPAILLGGRPLGSEAAYES